MRCCQGEVRQGRERCSRYVLVDAVFKGDGTAVVAVLERLVNGGRVVLGTTESLDNTSLSFRDGGGRRLVLVLLLLGMGTLARFSVLAVGSSRRSRSDGIVRSEGKRPTTFRCHARPWAWRGTG